MDRKFERDRQTKAEAEKDRTTRAKIRALARGKAALGSYQERLALGLAQNGYGVNQVVMVAGVDFPTAKALVLGEQ